MLLVTRLEKRFLVARPVMTFSPSRNMPHYGGPLAEGRWSDCTCTVPGIMRVSIATCEAIAAPALKDVACYKTERGERFSRNRKIDKKAGANQNHLRGVS